METAVTAPMFDPVDSIGTLLRARAQAHPEHVAVGVGDQVLTVGELDRRSDEVAAAFAARGVGRGDRVAVLAPSRIEVVEIFFGLAKLGAIQVPLNAFLKGAFLRHQLIHSKSSALVADGQGLAAAEPLLGELDDLQLLVTLDPSESGTGSRPVLDYHEITAGTGEAPDVPLTPADTLTIAYTSGTTGLPKGCVLSQGYLQRAAWMLADHGLGLGGDDVIYTPFPLFHLGGQQFLVISLLLGIPVHFEPAFRASEFVNRMTEVGATATFGIGMMAMALLATPDGPADRGHQVHTMAFVPLPPDAQVQIEKRFGVAVYTGSFGQTECNPITLTCGGDDHDRIGCGRPAPDLEVALLDERQRPVPDGEAGEICIRPLTPFSMFDRYWDQPDSTLEAFRGLWYHTGDAARRLPTGELVFVDRVKDALRRRGENVSSLELEAAIRAHPKVADVAVHAIPSSLTEDEIKACIILAPGETTDPEELFDFFRTNLPYFALPRYVEILDDFPRNAMGRVMKHVLRDRGPSEDTWDFDAIGLKVASEERRANQWT